MQDPYKIVMSMIRTEKGSNLGPLNKYLFWVSKSSNKIVIKWAVEQIYKVKVSRVNTCIMSGKKRRVRFEEGSTPDWKKAIVTLKAGEKIDVA